MTEIITPSDHNDWLALRKRDITSTESSALFGASPYVTRFDLYHRKRSYETPEFVVNDRMKWGNYLEAAIAQGIATERGWDIRPMKEYMRLPDERIGASFDFMILNHPGGPAHLEIKNVDYMAFKDGWIVEDGETQAPVHIEFQVQHQMLVSGFPRSFIGALVGGNNAVVIERERDEGVIKSIRKKISEFWRDVEAGKEPPAVMPEDADVMIRMNQYAEPGKVVDSSGDEELKAMVLEYKAETAKAKSATEYSKVLKAKIFERVGDAEKILLSDAKISCSMRADTPPTVITAEMIGQTYGGRKGFRDLRIN